MQSISMEMQVPLKDNVKVFRYLCIFILTQERFLDFSYILKRVIEYEVHGYSDSIIHYAVTKMDNFITLTFHIGFVRSESTSNEISNKSITLTYHHFNGMKVLLWVHVKYVPRKFGIAGICIIT